VHNTLAAGRLRGFLSENTGSFDPLELPKLDAADQRAVAVSVAESALAQAGAEDDPEIQDLLFRSARSSLLFAQRADLDADLEATWWAHETEPYSRTYRPVRRVQVVSAPAAP
jgi:hypothetical protein